MESDVAVAGHLLAIQRKQFNGNCNHCRNQGHQKTDCWELPENAAKRPASYQGHSEQVNIYVDTRRGGGVEFVLSAIYTHPACLKSCYTDQEKEVMEVEVLTMTEESELGLVNLTLG